LKGFAQLDKMSVPQSRKRRRLNGDDSQDSISSTLKADDTSFESHQPEKQACEEIDQNDGEDVIGEWRSNVLPISKISELRAAIAKTGVVYLSRIPPRLSPTKIRQLLSPFGSPVLRIFLAPEPTAEYTRRVKSGGSKRRQFTEGWVEFEDKKVAKKAAELLNAQRIGSKKGDFWYDDLWCIKYLPKFKWHHLTEQTGMPLHVVC
jgi:ESF2/ABP1 family protein